MSKCISSILNGSTLIGSIWETEKGKIVILNGEKIDLRDGLEIYNNDENKFEKGIDLLELLSEKL